MTRETYSGHNVIALAVVLSRLAIELEQAHIDRSRLAENTT